MSKYLIIGNSAAAVGAVEGIRRTDAEGQITVLSREKYHTYSRPLISYLLEGKTDLDRMKYRPDSFYADNKADFVNAEAREIRPKEKIVVTDKGDFSYDKLLIATGSNPFIPPFEGLDSVEDKFTFMSLDDALGIREKVSKGSRVLIIGAGLIGLKCAEALAKLAGSVTVTDISAQVMPSVLDEECAALVKKVIEDNEIRFNLSDSVKRFEKGKAYMASGGTIEFDILVVAAGVRPNTTLFGPLGEAARGIPVDEMCKTPAEDIYAAGDCTVSFDITTGKYRILALLPNAYMQGCCAGTNMAGGNMEYKNAFPLNAIGFFGYHILSAGSMAGDSFTQTDGTNYKRLFTEGGKLKGFLMSGEIARAGIYTSLIREQTPLDEIDFELLKHNPSLAALGLSKIKKCLGEEV